jgi:antitoxin CptB
MTGTTRSSEGLSERRRKLLFRSWHRGIREMDLIMGGFADVSIAAMTDGELDELERLLDVPDQEIYSWFTGEGVVPAQFDSALFKRMREFSNRRGDTR